MGGVVSGALTGLAADLAAGGLTFGAGMLAGAVLGALGGAGIARGVNVARGKTGAALRWDDAFLDGLVASALLRYLAVAHYGRGRGEWAESEYPPFWPPIVAEAVERRRDALAGLWSRREPACDADEIAQGLSGLLADATRDVLDAALPGSAARAARIPRRRARPPRRSGREAFGELQPLHLARRPLRQLGDEAERLRRLVAAELAQAMRAQLVLARTRRPASARRRRGSPARSRGRECRPPPPRAPPGASAAPRRSRAARCSRRP